MAKKKHRDESTSVGTECSDSKESVQEDVADFDNEELRFLQECIEIERKTNEDQILRAIKHEEEECTINSYLLQKNVKRIPIKVSNTTIEDDIEIITRSQ